MQDRLRPVFLLRGDLGRDELLRALEPWDSPANSLSVRTAIRAYISAGVGHLVEKTLIAARIGSSGGQRPGRTGDWWTDGDAQLLIDNVTSYVFPPPADGEPVERCDVRANIDLLVSFLSVAAGSLDPLGFKVHTDDGPIWCGGRGLGRPRRTCALQHVPGPVLPRSPRRRRLRLICALRAKLSLTVGARLDAGR